MRPRAATQTNFVSTRRWLLTMLMLCLLQPASVAIAQTEAERDQYAAIEIIRLQHRDANLIRMAVMPALDPRGSISRIDNNLIVASTRANLRELRTLIQQLDLPRQLLLISVDFNFNNDFDNDINNDFNNGETVAENIQSVQILDGDTVIIREQQPALESDLLNEAETDLDRAAASSQQAAMVLSARAEIRGPQVYITLKNATPPADRISTSLSVTPGQWVLVNPLAPVLPLVDEDPASIAADPATAAAGLRELAVRVELLP